MKLARRGFLHLAASAAARPAVSWVARAHTYPTRPVRVIVSFPPGGVTDTIARPMGQYLSDRLGKPFIIENRPGGGTNIGTEAVVRAPPDGHTLLFATTANAINASLWFGLCAPKNTPAEIIDRLNREVNAGLADAQLKARLADLGAVMLTGSPAEFGRLI
jgi:tripartite-type tricarboxylate transporter receptor subunit TctC